MQFEEIGQFFSFLIVFLAIAIRLFIDTFLRNRELDSPDYDLDIEHFGMGYQNLSLSEDKNFPTIKLS